ncbi:DUF192 domain-containing protein [Geminicoccus flavidas]|uniref:DUF192 domain-containing protein n=1 Tax=Geminicoccus flavidas TaxID=2506407 RepID=UPI001F459F1F|nr:DUF192 domain-containing protein [Geminicoccus flavidas]
MHQGKARGAGLLLAFGLAIWLAPAALAQDLTELTIHTRQGPLPYFVELARTPSERSRGLMFREELPKDHGMLFDFGQEQSVSFWMKNTPLPLDLIFIKADGEIVRITEQAEPHSLKLLPSGQPVRYVLEILGGTARERGIRPGDRLGEPLPE